MPKSHVTELSRVYAAIFQDATYAYPTLREEFEKDQTRLAKFVMHRGITTYVVDLPALGKHFDRCLSDGQYKLSGLPLGKRYSNRVQIPKFLRGLYLLVFDEFGVLKEDYDVQAIFFIRQLLYAAKRTSLQCSEDAVLKEIEDFIETDNALPLPDKVWSEKAPTREDFTQTYGGFASSERYCRRVSEIEDRSTRDSMSVLLRNLDIVSGILTTTLGPYSYGEWRFRHGPGAISEAKGPTNKYSWTNWPDRLENAYPVSDCGFHNFGEWAGSVMERSWGSEEPHSRLIDVPKTYTKPRLIAAEPSAHQWCQQNLWHYFCDRSANSWISRFVTFRDQTRNQELCRLGSQDGSLCTVDLSAASDRVTPHAVGNLFRRNPELLLSLQASRTRFCQIDFTRNGKVRLELRKFSTMGSACTFPVESFMFLCVAVSAVLTKKGLRPTLRNITGLEGKVTVFGDDIIVPEESRELLIQALEVLDFKVNLSKTYWNGKFRESCGLDAYEGHDVTPVYWRAPYRRGPESYARTVDTANNFYRKFLLHTSAYLESTIRRSGFQPPVVPYGSGFCGLKSFVEPHYAEAIPGLRTKPLHPNKRGMARCRFHTVLQRTEYLVPTLSCQPEDPTPVTDGSALLQWFTEEPSPFQHWESGVRQRPHLKIRMRWVDKADLVAQASRP